ncbi:MAG: ZIP family metal transporter [Solirubrobacterales bacterium]|nr:ZIP family metal transporter [Solirubrobacterales bacterium]
MDEQLIAIPLATLTVLTTLGGGWLALRMSHSLPTLIALSGGVVVAVAMFEVLPEAIELLEDDPDTLAPLIGAGFLSFFLAERVLVLHHRDDPEDARSHGQVGVLGALGLSAHSFVDGLAIGLAFGADTAVGVLVLVAVLSHDFADGLNTVSFVLSQSDDRKRAKRWLWIDAVAPLVGATVGALIHVSDVALGQLLAFYVGFFLYMGATDLLPEAHEHGSWGRVGLTVLGFAAIFGVSLLTG